MKLFTAFALALGLSQTIAIEQPSLRKRMTNSFRQRQLTLFEDNNEPIDLTFEEAMAEPAAGDLPMAECNQ